VNGVCAAFLRRPDDFFTGIDIFFDLDGSISGANMQCGGIGLGEHRDGFDFHLSQCLKIRIAISPRFATRIFP
jgi:hypothetical protein